MSSASAPSLTKRVFAAQLILAVLVTLVVAFFAGLIFQRALIANAQDELKQECRLVEDAIQESSVNEVTAVAGLDLGGVRLTLIDPTGTVIYDSVEPAAKMANHSGRAEFEQALATGEGSSERVSATLDAVSFYHALRLPSGNVVRLSVEREGITATLSDDYGLLIALVCVVLALAWCIARWLSCRLVQPILAIDPAHPASSEGSATYEELTPMVERLEQQQETLRAQMAEIESAADVRQEFTANVTHELKTPLSSISAAAELIRDGIARPEDIPDFAGRIYDETARLTVLVNDILTLSKLDESERSADRSMVGPVEQVDLSAVARDVAERLARMAGRAEVRLSCMGEPMLVEGNARLLDEMVYNLVDNAIRYNRPGGAVAVEVSREDGHPVLRVADTGCGIEPEVQAKVFERFFRVDKSRSRESGGTGLGLAIVKHAAAFCKAEITLESEPKVGTTFTVRFPAANSGAH